MALNNLFSIEKIFQNKWYFISLGFLFILFTFIVIPPIFILQNLNIMIPEAWDSTTGHIPLINYFIKHSIHLFNYPSLVSTLPGYHIFLSQLAFLLGIQEVVQSTWAIRLINALMGYALILTIWKIVWKLKPNVNVTFALLFPIAFSYYVVASSVWINTDNFAALLYSLLISAFLFSWPLWSATLVAFGLIFSRQLYYPVIMAFWVPAIFPKKNVRFLQLAFYITAVTTTTLALYTWHWKGLTPISSQHINQFVGVNPSAFLQAIAMTGLLAIAYLPIFFTNRHYHSKNSYLLAGIFILFTVLIWANTFSNYDDTVGRNGSIIWRIAKITPLYNNHSIAVLLLSCTGIITLGNMILHAIYYKYYPIEVIMLMLYFISYSSQILSFQRYVEIPILITFAIFGARTSVISRAYLLGPLLLGSSFILFDIMHLWKNYL